MKSSSGSLECLILLASTSTLNVHLNFNSLLTVHLRVVDQGSWIVSERATN